MSPKISRMKYEKSECPLGLTHVEVFIPIDQVAIGLSLE